MRLVIVGAQVHLQRALTRLLDQQPYIEILGALGPEPDLVDRILALQPEVVLIDWDLPGQLARQILAELRRVFNAPCCIALCTWAEDEPHAYAAGAHFLLSKTEPPSHLLEGLQSIEVSCSRAIGEDDPPHRRAASTIKLVPQALP